MRVRTKPTPPATDAQRDYIHKLVRKLEPGELADEFARAASMHLNAFYASRLIHELKRVIAEQKPPTDQLPTGVYAQGDTLYLVKHSRSGHAYAKRIETDREHVALVYAPDAITHLVADQRLGADEVVSRHLWFALCSTCSAVLTNTESVALGIGPICRHK